jgi:DNA-binding GntR family transcriptional regulator
MAGTTRSTRTTKTRMPASPASPVRTQADPAVDTAARDSALAADAIDQRLYRAVFDSVMSRRLPPGTKLPEAALCELFGVGRTVVRRVLQALAHDRIVELRPNRGAIVAMPTPEETREVFEARRGIEAAIVRLATERATPDDLMVLRAQLQAEHGELHAEQPAWARLASTFHLTLARLSGNAILERYLTETLSRCSLIVALYEPPGNADCEHAEHTAVVDCIARGDAEAAIEMMDAHLRTLERNICLRPQDEADSLRHMLGLD